MMMDTDVSGTLSKCKDDSFRTFHGKQQSDVGEGGVVTPSTAASPLIPSEPENPPSKPGFGKVKSNSESAVSHSTPATAATARPAGSGDSTSVHDNINTQRELSEPHRKPESEQMPASNVALESEGKKQAIKMDADNAWNKPASNE